MSEEQRDYLADLANQKGVVLENTDDVSRSWASNKIDELKAMPDAEFEELTDEIILRVDQETAKILVELSRWTLVG